MACLVVVQNQNLRLKWVRVSTKPDGRKTGSDKETKEEVAC